MSLNENSKLEKMAAGDHYRVQIVQIKPLQAELIKRGYKCKLLSHLAREAQNVDYDMVLRRNSNETSYVKIYRRRRSTDSNVIMLPIGKFDDKNSVFDDDKINEICIICPPQMNWNPSGMTVDNTKACFFKKDSLLVAYVDGTLKARTTKNGDSIVIPEAWAKKNAIEVIPYKYLGSSKTYNNKFDFNAAAKKSSKELNEKQQISKWINDHFKILHCKNMIDKSLDMQYYVPNDGTKDSKFYADGDKPSKMMKFFRDHDITKFIGNYLGFSEKEQKWYGWSHRAIHGFGIGDNMVEIYPSATKTGKKCKTLDDCKKAAKAFAKSVA